MEDLLKMSKLVKEKYGAKKAANSEREALARGLRLHLEDRVFIRGNRTVIFD